MNRTQLFDKDPRSIEEAELVIQELVARIQEIDIQLGNGQCAAIGGRILSDDEYEAWRVRALRAKKAIIRRLWIVKTWLKKANLARHVQRYETVDDLGPAPTSHEMLRAVLKILRRTLQETGLSLSEGERDIVELAERCWDEETRKAKADLREEVDTGCRR